MSNWFNLHFSLHRFHQFTRLVGCIPILGHLNLTESIGTFQILQVNNKWTPNLWVQKVEIHGRKSICILNVLEKVLYAGISLQKMMENSSPTPPSRFIYSLIYRLICRLIYRLICGLMSKCCFSSQVWFTYIHLHLVEKHCETGPRNDWWGIVGGWEVGFEGSLLWPKISWRLESGEFLWSFPCIFAGKEMNTWGFLKRRSLVKRMLKRRTKMNFHLEAPISPVFFLANDAFLALSPSIGYADDDEIW